MKRNRPTGADGGKGHQTIRRASTTLLVAALLALVSTTAAWADELVVDGDGLAPVTGQAMNLGTVCSGQQKSGTALLAIRRTGQGQGALQNVFSNNSSATVSAGTPGGPNGANVTTAFVDNGIALTGNWTGSANNTVSADTANSTVTVSAAGAAGARSATVLYTATGTNASASGGALSRTTTLTVNWSVAVCDSTAPTASPTQNPLANGAGWNNTDVTVTWNWADEAGGSGIDTANCTSSSTSSGEGMITLSATCTDLAGNTASATYDVKVDKTAPDATATAAPPANANGWNNTDVTVSFSGTDSGSGIAGCSADVVLSGEGENQSASGSCTDDAGNETPASRGGINIDKTAPAVALVGGPADGATYAFGAVPSSPGCSAVDLLSGIDGTCSVTGYGATIGAHTVVAKATDNAGNVGEASASYTVIAWTLDGFQSPVDMGFMNTVKGGSTVPLKFRVFAGADELTNTTAINGFSAVQISCSSLGSMPTAPVEELTATGNTGLRYDATSGHFIYNWKTPKQPGKCYQVTLTTKDGSTLVANFKLS